MTEFEESEYLDKEIEKLEQELYQLKLRKERIIRKQEEESRDAYGNPFSGEINWGNSRLEDGGSDFK